MIVKQQTVKANSYRVDINRVASLNKTVDSDKADFNRHDRNRANSHRADSNKVDSNRVDSDKH